MKKRIATRILAALVSVALVWGCAPLLDSAGNTAMAVSAGDMKPGYEDGYYTTCEQDIGDADSAGTGYKSLGDKFKVLNDRFDHGMGVLPFIHPNDTASQSYDKYTITIMAAGNGMCKEFTFKDMKVGANLSMYHLEDVDLVLKGIGGDTLYSKHYDTSLTMIDTTTYGTYYSLANMLSDTWNVDHVATIEFSFKIFDSTHNTIAWLFRIFGLDVANILGDNRVPIISNVSVEGGFGKLGQTLTCNYTYFDKEGDPEGATAYQWYWAVNMGALYAPEQLYIIENETGKTFTPTSSSLMYRYIFCKATPVAQTGTAAGTGVLSNTKYQISFAADPTASPTATPSAAPTATPATDEITLHADGGTGIVVTGNGTTLPAGASLSADESSAQDSDNNAVAVMYDNQHIAVIFNIRLQVGADAVQPNGPVTVGIPVPSGLQGQTLTIVRINDDGTVTAFETTQRDGFLYFTTDHFSRYAILAADEENPDTGDRSAGPAGLLWLTAAAIAAGVAAYFLRKRRQVR